MSSAEQKGLTILREYGQDIADKARNILLEDPSLNQIEEPLQFIKTNWLDLTPALMRLSCLAVGGQKNDVDDAALAMCLTNLSFTTWDDIIDNARYKSFKPTVYGKFGQAQALILGGLSTAKAFLIFADAKMENGKKTAVSKIMWQLWTSMATEETNSIKMRQQENQTSKAKLLKIESESINLATITKIGAIIGNGSLEEQEALEKYGCELGIILALKQDFHVSLNFTVELVQKINENRLPYSFLWAQEQSNSLAGAIQGLKNKQSVDPCVLSELITVFLSTGAFRHISNMIEEHTRQALEAISKIKRTDVSTALATFADIQSQIFWESVASKSIQDISVVE
ncbi:MAG: polyprenyl synthetase family protein [Candidatus Bathyarchaeota archaeon]|nr:polyprenyl synthetase family protein [Candidatus Bathyarchaeota archaeon]